MTESDNMKIKRLEYMLGYPQITCKYIKDKEKLVFGLGREHNSSGNDTQGILSKGLGDRMLGFKSSCVY